MGGNSQKSWEEAPPTFTFILIFPFFFGFFKIGVPFFELGFPLHGGVGVGEFASFEIFWELELGLELEFD